MTHSKTIVPANNWPGIEGARVLVTGASSGLGVHFAQTLAAHGAHVAAAARRVEKVQSLCDTITAQGGQATALQLDVSDADAVNQTLAGQVFDAVFIKELLDAGG